MEFVQIHSHPLLKETQKPSGEFPLKGVFKIEDLHFLEAELPLYLVFPKFTRRKTEIPMK